MPSCSRALLIAAIVSSTLLSERMIISAASIFGGASCFRIIYLAVSPSHGFRLTCHRWSVAQDHHRHLAWPAACEVMTFVRQQVVSQRGETARRSAAPVALERLISSIIHLECEDNVPIYKFRLY